MLEKRMSENATNVQSRLTFTEEEAFRKLRVDCSRLGITSPLRRQTRLTIGNKTDQKQRIGMFFGAIPFDKETDQATGS